MIASSLDAACVIQVFRGFDAQDYVLLHPGYRLYQKVYFLWRPYLPDAKDDLVLELAVAAQISTIVTHNLKDFVAIDKFGVKAISPKTLLERLT